MKLYFNTIIAFITLAMITSCLSESTNKISLGNYPGVIVKHGDSAFVYLKNNDVIFSSTGVSNVDNGDCVIIDFTLDYGLKENSDSGKVKGFLTANLKKVTRIPQSTLRNSLTDTTVALTGERTLSSVFEQNAFIFDRFFLFTGHRADSLPLQFELSYSQKYDSEHIYDLYLRVNTKANEAVSTQPVNYVNAFFIEDLSRRETDSLFFRINYVKQFNSDSSVISWASTPVYRYKIFR